MILGDVIGFLGVGFEDPIGLGRDVVNAISRRDLPAMQGSVLFLCVVFVAVNLLTDLAYAKADPRVAYE